MEKLNLIYSSSCTQYTNRIREYYCLDSKKSKNTDYRFNRFFWWKKTVKEITKNILRESGTTLSTYNNFNNNVGVLMTLLWFTHTYQYAVIELGTNNPGEIVYTARLTSLHIVLINNVYHSHLQEFASLTGVAYAKQEILNKILPFGTFIMNQNNNHWSKWKKNIHF